MNIASRGATMAVDWEQRVNFDRLRNHRLSRANRSKSLFHYSPGPKLRWLYPEGIDRTIQTKNGPGQWQSEHPVARPD